MIRYAINFVAAHWLAIWFAASVAASLFIFAAGALGGDPKSQE